MFIFDIIFETNPSKRNERKITQCATKHSRNVTELLRIETMTTVLLTNYRQTNDILNENSIRFGKKRKEIT